MNILKRAKASFKARIVIPYKMNHFEKTKYGKEILTFKNIHEGESCFIIGNGPSLNPGDLEMLYKSNIPCFASNNILKMFDKTHWRPEYYVCEDLLVLEDLFRDLNRSVLKNVLIPINYKWYNGISVNNAKYFKNEFQSNGEDWLLSKDCSKMIASTGTVTITSIQLAAYMGFKNIYLLGIDHNYRVTQDSHGNIITDNSVTDYFDHNYASTMKEKNIPNLEKTTSAYKAAKAFFEKNGVNIYNATRGGKLEVFSRVNFDDIVR